MILFYFYIMAFLTAAKAVKVCVLPRGTTSIPYDTLLEGEDPETLDATRAELTSTEGMEQLSSLQELKISGNKIGTLADGMWSLKRLRKLEAGRCGLKAIPAALMEMKNLAILFLFGNELTDVPRGIMSLDKLTFLNLSNNYLEKIPIEVCALRLEHLNVCRNRLKNVPTEIGRMMTLKTLDLSENKLTRVPDLFRKLRGTVEKIDLTGNPLESYGSDGTLGSEDMKDLFGEHCILGPHPKCEESQLKGISIESAYEEQDKNSLYWNMRELSAIRASASIRSHTLGMFWLFSICETLNPYVREMEIMTDKGFRKFSKEEIMEHMKKFIRVTHERYDDMIDRKISEGLSLEEEVVFMATGETIDAIEALFRRMMEMHNSKDAESLRVCLRDTIDVMATTSRISRRERLDEVFFRAYSKKSSPGCCIESFVKDQIFRMKDIRFRKAMTMVNRGQKNYVIDQNEYVIMLWRYRLSERPSGYRIRRIHACLPRRSAGEILRRVYSKACDQRPSI